MERVEEVQFQAYTFETFESAFGKVTIEESGGSRKAVTQDDVRYEVSWITLLDTGEPTEMIIVPGNAVAYVRCVSQPSRCTLWS